jgi:hypothetical protein
MEIGVVVLDRVELDRVELGELQPDPTHIVVTEGSRLGGPTVNEPKAVLSTGTATRISVIVGSIAF